MSGEREGRRIASLDLLARLVAFETESSLPNIALIDFVADYLAGWNVPFVRVPNDAGDKHALFATIGPCKDGGIVLSGHTDTVPVAGQSWTSNPFELRVENGRAHGRGAVDMKGFDALCLAAVPDLVAADLVRPVHILLSFDEETSCLGSTGVIERFGRDLPRPSMAIVGEPTDLAVVDAHKSVQNVVTTVFGHAAHSSKPERGANAVAAAADLVHGLNLLADEMMARGDPSGRFDPPYTSVHVGVLEGGNARNILARECRLVWEVRGLPDLDPQEVPRRFGTLCREVEHERLNRFGPFGRIETEWEVPVPGLAPDPGSEAERLGLALTGAARTETVPFGTEAGHFQAAGLSTVVCGPGKLDSAHQPDEYITLDELAAGEAFLRRLGDACRTG